ncbi:hypothetical protein, partial [Gardnerella pickettii]|uniref:hypothetical protein n=1 Tax=Gardnerella pickettii TaxID=2914924 RepID=UPI0003548BEC
VGKNQYFHAKTRVIFTQKLLHKPASFLKESNSTPLKFGLLILSHNPHESQAIQNQAQATKHLTASRKLSCISA